MSPAASLGTALGHLEGLREEYFAVTPQSESAHPALEALVAGAGRALASK